MQQDQTTAPSPSLIRGGHALGRRLYRIKDNRLLRRLPWKSEDRAPILEALGAATVPDHVDVRALRGREGLSRQDFARIYGLSLDSVRSWERGVRPSKATRAYLATIAANPQTVRRALGVNW
jgi:DNA-binding transcriptional regulator YiaG